MNCDQLSEIIGMRCNPLGSAVEVVTPFTFPDGGGIEVFARTSGPVAHFFDDGCTMMHLHGVGIRLNSTRNWLPLRTIAESNGVTLSHNGVFEVTAPIENASLGFAKLVSALLGVASWVRDQVGVSQDRASLVDEVALYLRAWKPGATFIQNPTATGLSGRTLKFDFQVNNQYVDAVSPNWQSTGSELRKAVDLNTSYSGDDSGLLVIVEDRINAAAAKQEIEIIGRVAVAWPMSRLIGTSNTTLVAQ